MTTVVHYQLRDRQYVTAIDAKTVADEYYACGTLAPNYPMPALNYYWPRSPFAHWYTEGWCKAKFFAFRKRH